MIKLFSKNTYKHSYLLLDLGTGDEKSTTDVNAWKFMIRFGFFKEFHFSVSKWISIQWCDQMTATFAEEPGCNYFLFWGELFGKKLNMKAGKKSKMKRQYCSLCLKLPHSAQSLVFSSQIVTQIINTMSLLVD